MNKQIIGARIKYERERLGLTQPEFGKQIGVSKQCLSGWENGRTSPDVITLSNIAKLCHVSLESFLKAEDEYKTEQLHSSTVSNVDGYTEKEQQIINKIRAMSAERRMAVEILLGVRSNKK